MCNHVNGPCRVRPVRITSIVFLPCVHTSPRSWCEWKSAPGVASYQRGRMSFPAVCVRPGRYGRQLLTRLVPRFLFTHPGRMRDCISPDLLLPVRSEES